MHAPLVIDLTGKVALITGAGGGIGEAIASTFARAGASIVAFDRDGHALDAAAQRLRSGGASVITHAVDITDANAVQAAADASVAGAGRLDILVNNAGVTGDGLIAELDDTVWQRCLDVNLTGVFHMCRAVIPTMQRQRSGRILNAASFAAIIPIVGSAAYAAAKAGVAQLSRGLAGELGPWDITVNAYAPGMVPTGLNGFAELPEPDQQTLLDTLTLRRWGAKGDVAGLLAFLASDLGGYITGTMIDVSGGKLATQIPSRAYEVASAQE